MPCLSQEDYHQGLSVVSNRKDLSTDQETLARNLDVLVLPFILIHVLTVNHGKITWSHEDHMILYNVI